MNINAAFLVILAVTTGTASVSAQGSSQWSAVERLRVGAIVVVADDSGTAVRGRVLRVDAKSILLAAPDEARHLRPRAGVVSVTRPKDQRRSLWPTLAGVALGGALGFYSGMVVALNEAPCQPNCGPRGRTAGALIFGGPIVGGLIGHAIGKPRSDQVIYHR